jgi:hypothetical protein
VKHAAKVHRYEGLGSFRYALEVWDDAGHDVWSLPAECDSLVARAAQVWQAEIERLRTLVGDMADVIEWCGQVLDDDPDALVDDTELNAAICALVKEARRG